MNDNITREALLHTIFEEIDDNTGKLDTPELKKQQDEYTNKWIDTAFSGKERFAERDNATAELWQLIQNYKKAAFAVGFDAALALMQKGQ